MELTRFLKIHKRSNLYDMKAKKYNYKAPYEEKKQHVRYRRCKFCKELCSVKKMENYYTCKKCYILQFDKKRCKVCSLLKKLDQFHSNYMSIDGFYPECKGCRKTYPKTHKTKKIAANIEPTVKKKNMNRFQYYKRKNKHIVDAKLLENIKLFYLNCPKGMKVLGNWDTFNLSYSK